MCWSMVQLVTFCARLINFLPMPLGQLWWLILLVLFCCRNILLSILWRRVELSSILLLICIIVALFCRLMPALLRLGLMLWPNILLFSSGLGESELLGSVLGRLRGLKALIDYPLLRPRKTKLLWLALFQPKELARRWTSPMPVCLWQVRVPAT